MIRERKGNWGGRRPGAGRPKKGATVKEIGADAPSVKRAGRRTRYLPLDYMLAVMNDETADLRRRARMAIAALPFLHKKIGKKAQRP